MPLQGALPVLPVPPVAQILPGLAVGTPTGAAFDVVLIFHVGLMLVGLASVLATGVQAWRARAGPEAQSASSVARYFRPGINWPGRSIYLVLVLGLVLVAMSRGAYDFGDPFVQIGLGLWIAAAALAELVVWPGERRLQRIISDRSWPASTDESAGIGARVALSAWAVCVVLLIATVVMVQKP